MRMLQLLLAAPSSGSGKTTAALLNLKANRYGSIISKRIP